MGMIDGENPEELRCLARALRELADRIDVKSDEEEAAIHTAMIARISSLPGNPTTAAYGPESHPEPVPLHVAHLRARPVMPWTCGRCEGVRTQSERYAWGTIPYVKYICAKCASEVG